MTSGDEVSLFEDGKTVIPMLLQFSQKDKTI
jgi:hypothetical protein